MAPGKGLRWASWAFIAVSLLCGVYFMLANYWKWIPHLGGIVWAILGIAMLIALAVGARRVYAVGCILVALLQIPIIFCYIIFFGIQPTLMGVAFRPGIWGVVFHCCVLAAAVSLAVMHFKHPQTEACQ